MIFRSNFSPAHQNSIRPFKLHHGQSSTSLFVFQWHRSTSKSILYFIVIVILSKLDCIFLRSSMKSKQRNYNHDVNGNSTLPERLFQGTFVVFTVTALLELPTGVSVKNFKASSLGLINIYFSHQLGSKELTNHWSDKEV